MDDEPRVALGPGPVGSAIDPVGGLPPVGGGLLASAGASAFFFFSTVSGGRLVDGGRVVVLWQWSIMACSFTMWR